MNASLYVSRVFARGEGVGRYAKPVGEGGVFSKPDLQIPFSVNGVEAAQHI